MRSRALLGSVVVLLTLVGCATVDDPPKPQKWGPAPTASKDDPSLKSIPVRDRTPQAAPSQAKAKPEPTKSPEQVIADVTKPKASPSLTDVLKDKVLVSPYTMISPIAGKWAWVPDPTFVMVLTPEGQLQFGPTQAGFFQMVSPTAIRFQITQVNGVSVGGTAPQDWAVAFFENNTVLLLSKGAQAMPFKRLE